MTSPFETLDRYRGAVLSELRALLDSRPGPPYDLMRYHLGWEDERGEPVQQRAGKKLRPALCLLACEAVDGDWPSAVPAAAAIELLHNFTLIHDDVEDASAERHGRPTLWRLRGEAQAINAGDGMFALAHVALLRLADRGHTAERVLRAAELLDQTTLRLCEGQHVDLANAERTAVTRDEYLSMIEGKSAELLAASCAIGALLGGAADGVVAGLREFGRRLGLAFQVRDDYLGVWGDPAVTGKPASDDLRAGKKSYPVVLAIESAREDHRSLVELLSKPTRDESDIEQTKRTLERTGAREETERAATEHAKAAVDALGGIDLQPDRRRELEALARFAATREA